MQVRINPPARIADGTGTHEPDDVIDNPSQALLALAHAGTLNPETGTPYCEIVTPAPLAPAPAPAATPVSRTTKPAEEAAS